ncbi:MAG: ATP-dependent Clp protease ATP-binding subunit ClpA [Bacteriovoracia bacterium]
MIGRDAEEVLNRAVRAAFERQHEYFTLEHVLFSLLEDADILEVIHACGGIASELKTDLVRYLDTEVPKKKASLPSVTPAGDDSEASDAEEEPGDEHPVATLSIQRLIQRALFHVQSAGKDEIHPVDLLVALFQSKDSYALHLLKKHGVERLDVLSYVSHGVTKSEKKESSGESAEDGNHVERPVARSVNRPRAQEDALETYAVNLNVLAREGKIDPLIGRKNELERIVQTLCRRRKNNPILIGEAGVGKSALAEGLALKIVNGEVPDLLANAEVYALDLGSLLAGAKFRGDFENRFKQILKSLERKKLGGIRPLLMIDEIHTIIGAGAVSGGTLDAANLLKPLLSRGEIQCIGSTTYQEYRNIFEKDHALARRFQKIEIAEPSIEEAVQILSGLKERFEEHHRAHFTPEAIRAAVELSSKHIQDRFLPDKAIDVIDEAGARARIQSGADAVGNSVVDAPQVEEIVAKIAKIPPRSVNTSQKTRLKNLDRDLRLTLFGQDHAIEALVTAIRLARSGLRTGEKPVGSFLFCGPTGVGKTELSKQLAHSLGVTFLRFDMSEYMEKHTVSRLIGAPPGYVGFEQAGLLTDAVLKNPHSVVLLDEIEKAHHDIWNILLQVMDHGTLTDNNGRKADFRHTIIIMTSNVGSREAERGGLGFARGEATNGSVSKREVERAFSPEFRNRLDAIVYFNPLDPYTIAQVVGKQLLELENQLLARAIEIEIEPDVREWLAKHGYDARLGARPMGRLIQDRIKRPLSEEILFGKLEKGGKVRVRMKDEGELGFDIEAGKSESDPETTAVTRTNRTT